MSRKAKKRVQKKNVQPNVAVEIKNIEKNLSKTPLKLVAHLNKEIAQLRQKESKTKKALIKTNALVIKSQKKLQSSSPKRAKKNLLLAQKTQTALNKEINQISELLKVTIERRERLLALSKHIAQFSAVWAKSAKPVSKKASSEKSKKRKTQKPRSLTTVPAELPKATDESSSVDIGFGFDEQSKLAS